MLFAVILPTLRKIYFQQYAEYTNAHEEINSTPAHPSLLLLLVERPPILALLFPILDIFICLHF